MQRAKAVGSGSSVMGRSFVGSPAGWAMKAGSIANARSSRNLSEAEAATVFRGRDRNRFRGRIPSSDSESEFRIRKFGYRYGHVRPPRAARRSAFQRRPASLEASEALSGVTYVAGLFRYLCSRSAPPDSGIRPPTRFTDAVTVTDNFAIALEVARRTADASAASEHVNCAVPRRADVRSSPRRATRCTHEIHGRTGGAVRTSARLRASPASS